MVIPTEIQEAVTRGATLAVSVSGGKDSQALLVEIMRWYKSEGLTNPIFAIHADLGSVEWKQTPAHVKKICADAGVELVEVFKKCKTTGKRIGLMEGWKRRMDIMLKREKPSPHWSSSLNRYCTSDYKIRPIDAYLRKFTDIISIEGIRWEESKKRAEKPRVQVRQSIVTKKRKALTWYAIADYTTEQVWNADGQTSLSLDVARNIYKTEGIVPNEWNFHPAYAMGNSRLSCAICILANRSDVLNGVKHNPDVANEMEQMEIESGFTFQSNFSISEAKRQLEQGVKIAPKRTQTQFSLFNL